VKIFDIAPQLDDSAEFFEQVRTCLKWITEIHQPLELFLIKIDNWYGPNWLGFSGKMIGALGVWQSKLTMPPFVPHRVLWERRFVSPNYQQKAIRNMVHIEMPSQRALRRLVGDIAPNASLVWFSGGSLRNGRAALMAYLFSNESYWIWYTGWAEHSGWKIVKAIGITPEKFKSFASPSSQPD
jgi:hypothetical protein